MMAWGSPTKHLGQAPLKPHSKQVAKRGLCATLPYRQLQNEDPFYGTKQLAPVLEILWPK